MSLLAVTDDIPVAAWAGYYLGEALVKASEDGGPEIAYNLSGTLYLSQSGWILLSVPNSLAIGIFKAMSEPGIELPPGSNGKFNAHISVMRPEEVTTAGGADKIKERGKQFTYTLGRIYSVEPDGWPEMSRVWFCQIHSPELQELRRAYGLSSLPKNGDIPFHLSVAVRRRGVLGRNDMKKGG